MKLRTHILSSVVALTSIAMVGACTDVNDTSCTVVENTNGSATISCPDGTSAVVTGSTAFAGDHCSLSDNGDGTSILTCPDGSSIVIDSGDKEPTTPPTQPTDPPVDIVTPDGLTEADEARIDLLRVAIGNGLTLGQQAFLDEVDIVLADNGVTGYDSEGLIDNYSVSAEETVACPFVQYYDNGFVSSQVGCDFLLELAKIEMYAGLSGVLDDNPLPADVSGSEHAEEAEFWYEQGAVSGIEQFKVMVRADLKSQAICNSQPTVPESAYEKGLVVGASILAEEFNEWLADQGQTPDYPTMSNPIEVCNADESALDPAHKDALERVPNVVINRPLCADYAPPTAEHVIQYEQANIDYEKGIQDGIAAEFALAAVRIFKLIPCNVGDPVVVDLDGDGIELLPVHRGVNFDFYGAGRIQATAWVAGDDGLLVMDRNGNGHIDNGTELFGNVDQAFSDGFEHLAKLDANRDGVLDAADPAFGKLRVWQDRNSDAKTDAGELLELAQVGITSIPLQANKVSMRSAGVRIPLVVDAGGVLIGDALFTTAPFASPRLER